MRGLDALANHSINTALDVYEARGLEKMKPILHNILKIWRVRLDQILVWDKTVLFHIDESVLLDHDAILVGIIMVKFLRRIHIFYLPGSRSLILSETCRSEKTRLFYHELTLFILHNQAIKRLDSNASSYTFSCQNCLISNEFAFRYLSLVNRKQKYTQEEVTNVVLLDFTRIVNISLN